MVCECSLRPASTTMGRFGWTANATGSGEAIQGFNVPQRVLVTDNAVPGRQHTIALLAVNGPLGSPGGGIFVRYATLAFEWAGA